MRKSRVLLVALGCLTLGIVIGGNLFSRSRPRSLIALTRCQDCLRPSDLLGLMGSVGMQRFPGWVPFAVVETERTVALKYPAGGLHYVLIPKRDLRDIGEVSDDDAASLVDVYVVARHLIEKDHLTRYRFYTNGPGYQTATYWHFHLVSP